MKYKTVRELLNSEQRWLKRALAAMRRPCDLNIGPVDRTRVEPDDKRAVCFCLMGACDRIYPSGPRRADAYLRIMAAIRRRFPLFRAVSIAHFNDSPKTTHKHIKAVIREANV